MTRLGMARSAFAASAVAVALALAGCGGGGDADDRADRADAAVQDLRDRIAALEGDVTTLTGERDTARGRIADLEEMIGMMDDAADAAPSASLYAQLNAAREDAAGLRTDIGMMDDDAAADGSLYARINYHMGEVTRLQGIAGNMGDPADAMGSLHAQIAYHMGEATRIQGLLDTANGNLTTANGRISTLEGMIGDADDDPAMGDDATLYAMLNHYKAEATRLQKQIEDAEAAAAATAATEKAKAINAALKRNRPAAEDPLNPDAPMVDVAASTAGMLSATSTGYTDSGEAPDVAGLPSGWRGRLLTRGGNMLVVYSDIENAKGTPLSDLFNATRTSGQPTSYNTGTGNSEINFSEDYVEFDRTISETSGATPTHTFSGTVHGVAGTFTCTGAEADCDRPTYNTDGTISNADDVSGAAWGFVPDDPNALAAVADKSYLTVGWALIDNADKTYSYDSFATSTGMAHTATTPGTTNVTGENLTGIATYTGGAAGKYTLLDEIEDTASGGHWTATARLTANFAADLDLAAAGNDEDGVSVSGTISGFMVDGTSESAWNVTLSAADLNGDTDGLQVMISTAPAATADGAISGTTAWSRGGAASGTGEWDYTFHGPTGDATDGWLEPAAITGDFNSSVGNRAYIEGSFAAQRDEDE